MKKLYFLITLLYLSVSSFSQNLGIGISNPQNRLHVVSPADPLRLDGLQNYDPATDTVLLVTNPAMGVVRYIHVDSFRSELPDLDSVIIETLLNNTDTLFSIQSFRDSIIKIIQGDIDSIILTTIVNNADTLFVNQSFVDSIISTIYNYGDTLLSKQSFRDTLYSFTSDSLLRDSIWIRNLDSLLTLNLDTVYFNDTSYQLYSDSLLNDTLWLNELRDSLSFTESNIDSANLRGTVITIYEETDQASADLLPLASDSSFVSTLRGQLNDSIWEKDSLNDLVKMRVLSNGQERGDSVLFFMRDDGRLVIGDSIGTANLGSFIHMRRRIGTANIRLTGISGNAINFMKGFDDSPGASAAARFASGRGTEFAPAVVQDGDALGQLDFWGWTGRVPSNEGLAFSAISRVTVDGPVSAGDNHVPTRFSWHTSDGSFPRERMRLDRTGNLAIGNTNPLNRLHITSSGDPLRLEGLVNQKTDSVLGVDGNGVVKYFSIDSISSDNQNLDSMSLSGTMLTTYIEDGNNANEDLLPLASNSSFYSVIRDSLLRDSLFTSTVDSLILSVNTADTLLNDNRFTDSLFTIIRDSLVRDLINLTNLYTYTSDSLLNDTAWLSELKDSVESNIDSANLQGTTITVYEEADQASTDLLPLASDSSFYTAIRDSLLNDTVFRDSTGGGTSGGAGSFGVRNLINLPAGTYTRNTTDTHVLIKPGDTYNLGNPNGNANTVIYIGRVGSGGFTVTCTGSSTCLQSPGGIGSSHTETISVNQYIICDGVRWYITRI